ncbi:hypothetical protein Calag_1132 [Caldisphaera lagunensis DSM 15908]|uniref:Uncharacterized protein n=1 Tax=Caldisphaera lagunensis (strain DSM 15908 / JCM 11604 / ANMR 0165 / IC-154) TaxID=1056495 RepID=L0ABQ0_CALLD|nr:hypothetical protein [Caldisphaera lagunensis]AFZ70854.1 hypothetical protein Calag_1132 [Caldisphaera lagunensis DSM 15908]
MIKSQKIKFIELKENYKLLNCKNEECLEYCKENKEIIIIMPASKMWIIGDRLPKDCIIIGEGDKIWV